MVTIAAPRDEGTDVPASWLRRVWKTPAASWTRVVLLFFVVATITHLPSFTRAFWNPDEGFLATQARALNSNTQGAEFYQIVVDRKPPLLPYVYAWVFRLVGDHAVHTLDVIRALAVVVHVVTAILITQIAKRRYGRHGVWAGLLYLCGSAGLAPEDAQAASFEVFMLPWTCAAFLFADMARCSKRQKIPLLGAAGVACAMGTLTKQTAGATMLPVLWRAWKDRRGPGVLTVVVAFIVPIIGVAMAVGFGDFFFWVFTGNTGYLTSLGPWTSVLARGWGNFGIFCGANAAAVLGIVYMTARGGIRRADTDLWLWLAGAVIGASSGFHFFGHYFLQLLPPIVILATGALARNGSQLRWTMLTASAVSATVFLVLAFTWPKTAQEHNNEVAQRVQDIARGPKESILVWGMNPELYFMADRPPASRYITAGFLSGFAGGGDQNLTVSPDGNAVQGTILNLALDLEKNRPKVIVDDSQGKSYAPEYIPAIHTLLEENYLQRADIGGTKIYELSNTDGLLKWAHDIEQQAAREAFLHPTQAP
jgi:hypothetical protein